MPWSGSRARVFLPREASRGRNQSLSGRAREVLSAEERSVKIPDDPLNPRSPGVGLRRSLRGPARTHRGNGSERIERFGPVWRARSAQQAGQLSTLVSGEWRAPATRIPSPASRTPRLTQPTRVPRAPRRTARSTTPSGNSSCCTRRTSASCDDPAHPALASIRWDSAP